MKTIKGIIWATFLFVGVTAIAIAGVPPSDTAGLQSVPSDQVPPFGTFWVLDTNGITAPLPCPPAGMSDAPIYDLGDGQFLVDERNGEGVSLSAALSAFDNPAEAAPLGGATPMDSPTVFSNAWFSEIVISNHTYISVDSAFLGVNGQPQATQLPPGAMVAVTSTNLALPLSQLQPVGPTNPIAPQTFNLPFNSSTLAAFFAFQLQIDTNADLASVAPYTLVATNLHLLTDYGVTVSWTNSQPGDAPEQDEIIIQDGGGHLYLVGSVVTTGQSNSYSFELTSTNGVTFLRQPSPATNGIYLYLPVTDFQNPDLVTIPYDVVNDPLSAPVIEVALYDVTDPSNPQLLVDETGDGCQTGTLEIPALLLGSGTRTLELQVTDASFGLTVTDFTVTIQNLIDVQFPILGIESLTNGSRVLSGSAGSGIAIQATTSATNGNWLVTEYDGPSGAQLQQIQVPVASTGGVLQYNDGGEPSGGYTNAWFEFTITIASTNQGAGPLFGRPSMPPSIPPTNRFRIYPTGPHYPAGEITCYDHNALPGNNSDKQYAMTAMQTEATMQSFTCYPIDFPNGVWTAVNPLQNPPTTSLYQESVWGWEAVNGSLADTNYTIALSGQWTNQTPSFAINNFFINGHGGTNGAGIAEGVQGEADNDQVSLQSLKSYQFSKKKSGLALAVFASCRIGNGPMMQFVLRNSGINGQISTARQQALNIRGCFGLGWNIDKPQDSQIYDYIAWWAYYSAYLNAGNNFQYTFVQAMAQASSQTFGNGGDGAVWSGCEAARLSDTVP